MKCDWEKELKPQNENVPTWEKIRKIKCWLERFFVLQGCEYWAQSKNKINLRRDIRSHVNNNPTNMTPLAG
jgi:hypothetical protein